MIDTGAGVLDSITMIVGKDIFANNGWVFYPGVKLLVLTPDTRVCRGELIVDEIVGDRLICNGLPVATQVGDLLQLAPAVGQWEEMKRDKGGEWKGLQRS